MRKQMLGVLVITGWLIACASVPTAPNVNGPTAVAPTVVGPTSAISVNMTPTTVPKLIKDDFTPTDPKTVNLKAGKPQLVEFYAVW